MAKKKAFALRVDEDMMKAMEKWAQAEYVSTTGQIERLLNELLQKNTRSI